MNTRIDQATRLIEVERAQIGHEIHDALLPLIFAACAGIRGLIDNESESSAENRQRLVQIEAWLDDAMQTGRRLLTQVYPPELADTQWTAAAKDSISRLFDHECPTINWQIDREVNGVSKAISSAAYRIVVEAIRNAIRHGQASQIDVCAKKEPGERPDLGTWCITVQDNGTGFDPAIENDGRFGIRSMIGRAALVAGELTLESKPGGPTLVRFRVPMKT